MGTSQSKTRESIIGTPKSPPVDQFVTPTGLYPTTNNWDLRQIKKLVLSKKLAPLFHGKEKEKETDFPNLEECPICFLNYPSLNRSLCCKKSICTERCPFCNRQNYNVVYTGVLSLDERKKDEEEQQKVIELKIKIRQEELERDKQREEERKNRQSTSPTSSSIDGANDQASQSLPITPSMVVRSLASSQDSSTPSPKETSISFPSSPIPPSTLQRRSGEFETDIDFDDMMLMEAIRLSIADFQKKETKPPVVNKRPTSPEHRTVNNTFDSATEESLHVVDTRDHSILNMSEHRVPSERESNSVSNVDTTRSNVRPYVPIGKKEDDSIASSQSGSKEEIPNLRSSMSSDQQEQYELELAISLSLQRE